MNRGRSWWAAVVLVAMSAASALALPPGTVEPIKTAPDVALTTADGEAFRLSGQRGKVVVLSFGFTLCPDVCGVTLAKLAQARARLENPADMRVVFVTLDPERDTPAALRSYTRRFDSAFIGLTGTARAVAQARDAYGVIAGRRPIPNPLGYLVDHSTFLFVVDRSGNLRLMLPAGVSIDDLTLAIRTLLAER